MDVDAEALKFGKIIGGYLLGDAEYEEDPEEEEPEEIIAEE